MANKNLENLLQFLDDAESETTSMLSARESANGVRRGPPNPHASGHSKRSSKSSFESVTSSLPPYPGFTPSGPTPSRRRAGRSRYGEEEDQQQQDLDELDHRISGFSLRSQSSSQRSFIWDQVDEHGNLPPDSGGKEAVFSSGASVASSGVSSITAVQSQYGDIEEKVESMKLELKERRNAVKALQSELDSLRKASAEYTKRAETKWQKELSTQRQQAALSMGRHTEFRAGLDKDISQLQEKLEDIEATVSKIVRTREAELDFVRKDCVKELKAAREVWLDSEKRRLARLAEKKEKEIKAQAVRQLEPELHNLISGNKKKLAAQRENNEIALKDEKLKLDKEMQQTLIDSLKAFEVELQEEGEAMRRSGQQRKRELMAENEKAAQKLKKEYHSELESERVRFESERKRRRDFILSEENTARTKQSSQVQQAISQYQTEASAISERYRKEIETEIRKIDLETERWKETELKKIREDLLQEKNATAEALKAKRDAELNMVLQRLQEESESEVAAFKAELTEKFNRAQANRKQRLDQCKAQEHELFQSFVEKTELEKKLKQEAQDMFQQKESALNEVESLKKDIEELDLKQEEQGSSAETRAMQLAAEGEREKNRLLHEYEQHSVRLDSVLSEVKIITPRLIEEENAFREKVKMEYVNVQHKVDSLLQKKDLLIENLSAELSALRDENENLAAQIDAHREKQIS